MCAICGIVSFAEANAPSLHLLKSMLGRLAHRGPDGSGYYRDRNAALGHNRLAIVDLQGGAQPLANESGDLWISFNGEIFNFVELTEDLKALGHRFRTRSDTEVVVHAFEQWGADCFSRFNGQWAVALWDSRRRRLTLCRDRLGIRPLYYTRDAGRLLFASEIKALFADRSVRRAFDPNGLAQLFTFWTPVAPATLFEGVSEVRPGHVLEFDVSAGSTSERPFWEPSFAEQGSQMPDDDRRNGELLRHELARACHLRFTRSDVPVGAYLSGGLDSSIVAALVARESPSPLETFSIRFAQHEFDEGKYQSSMSERLGTRHHEVAVSNADIARVFPSVVWHAERPLLRTAPAPLFLLSRLARDLGFKVVVTGEGADELLGGYDLYREFKVRLFLARNPGSTVRAGILQQLYPWMERRPGTVPAFAEAFFRRHLDPADTGLSHRPRWDTTKALIALLAPELRERVDAFAPDQELLQLMPQEHRGWDPLSRAQWLELMTLLPGYILSAQGDRMLMAHSVEGRFPFLDHNVAEFAGRLPARHKILGLEEKHILKLACGDLVPDAILRRPKQPYRAPDAAGFFAASQPEWLTYITDSARLRRVGLFKPDAVQKLISKCRAANGAPMSNTDNMRLVGVLSTLLVQQQFIDGDGGNGAHASMPPMTVAVDRA